MRRSACIAAAPGAAIVAVDTALALALGNTAVFVPLLVIGPLVAAALASPRCTLGVALLGKRVLVSDGSGVVVAPSSPGTWFHVSRQVHYVT